jgi:hypothetical protein
LITGPGLDALSSFSHGLFATNLIFRVSTGESILRINSLPVADFLH